MDRRLYHLDFLRAFALFVGVFYRSAHADAGSGDFDFVREASGAFRMACFFLISGYFSVALIERKGTLPFLKSRVVMLTVPALVCVVLLAPFTAQWMTAYYSEAGASKDFKMFWMYHAWFLFSLLAYTLILGYIVQASKWCIGCLSRFMSERMSVFVFYAFVIVVCALSYKVILPSFMWEIPYIHLVGLFVLVSVQHFPFFLLGVLMFLWKDIYDLFNRGYLRWGAAMLACIAGYLGLKFVAGSDLLSGGYAQAFEVFFTIYKYVMATLISVFLCAFSARFLDKDFAVVRVMTQSAYTVYVVHFLFVALLLMILQRAGMSMDLRMLTAAVATCFAGVAVHFILVKRFKLTALLFNGRLDYGSRQQADPAQVKPVSA
ncbi:acyltransferase family protein [Microbulbifer agarilyticus]